jgi:PKD repeat protein
MYDLTTRPIEPQAGFISNVTSGTAPLTVLFTDTSTGGVPTSWYWGLESNHNYPLEIAKSHSYHPIKQKLPFQ